MTENSFDKAVAAQHGTFIDAAYAMRESPIGDPLLPQQPADFPAGYHITAWIDMSDFALLGETNLKFYGFVARSDSDPYSHLIAVRGTEGWEEFWDDAICIPIIFEPVRSAGGVHYGFYRIYRTMRVIRYPRDGETESRAMSASTFADQIEELLSTLPDPEPGREHHLVVTGHSLGAALCTLYVMEHAIKKKENQSRRAVVDRICTFASPRVGLEEFAKQFDALEIESWRIANTQDLVPKLPPTWVGRYQHVERGYEFSSEGVVRPNLKCRHALATYLHWLDPVGQRLDPACKL